MVRTTADANREYERGKALRFARGPKKATSKRKTDRNVVCVLGELPNRIVQGLPSALKGINEHPELARLGSHRA